MCEVAWDQQPVWSNTFDELILRKCLNSAHLIYCWISLLVEQKFLSVSNWSYSRSFLQLWLGSAPWAVKLNEVCGLKLAVIFVFVTLMAVTQSKTSSSCQTIFDEYHALFLCSQIYSLWHWGWAVRFVRFKCNTNLTIENRFDSDELALSNERLRLYRLSIVAHEPKMGYNRTVFTTA